MPETDILHPESLNAAATEAAARLAASSLSPISQVDLTAGAIARTPLAASPRVEPRWENVADLRTSLSWTPSLHDKKLQLRILTAILLAGMIYACFHFGLYLRTRLALSSEQQRVDQLFENCLDHAGNSNHAVFSGTVRRAESSPQSATTGIIEAILPIGDGYTFAPWSDISGISDPTAFVGRLGSGSESGGRLVVVTVDGNPTGGRTDAGNLAIRFSTYASDLPLRRRWEGDAQLNVYLKEGSTFRVFEGSDDSDGIGAAIEIEADKKQSLIHARLLPDGVISVFDNAKEITHDTTVYELDLTGGE